MMPNLPIVVIAFNRSSSLERLLKSLSRANYPKSEVSLYISLDFSGNNDCNKLAEEFDWKFGSKKIIKHEKNLGLKNHVISCGEISQDNDGVILLEDDLVVSPAFYSYSLSALGKYGNDKKIAGCSLYSYELNEFCHLPFSSIHDNYDAFFMKVPSSCGQLYSKNQWQFFKHSLSENIKIESSDFLPEQVFNWPKTSWKKYFFKHMIKNNLYFTYPHISYSSNMGEVGTHFNANANFIRTNLNLKDKNFHFPNFDETINIYDQFMELSIDKITKKITNIKNYKEYEIDIFGSKPIDKINKKYIITSRETQTKKHLIPINFHPVQLNLFYNETLSGHNYAFNVSKLGEVIAKSKSFLPEYFSSCEAPAVKRFLIRITETKSKKLIKSTKRYRLGNLLISPFAKIKKMLDT